MPREYLKKASLTSKSDASETLDLALQASGCDRATVLHKPRLLRSHRCILNAVSLPPLGHRLDVDAQFPAQRRV